MQIKKYFKLIFVASYLFLVSGVNVLAEGDSKKPFDIFIDKSGYTMPETSNIKESVLSIVATVIAYALSFLGVIFLVLTIYAGFLWMTAGGNEEKVTKAKTIMKNSLIGLLIVFAAGVLTTFIYFTLALTFVG